LSVEVIILLMFISVVLGVASGFPVAFVLGGTGVIFAIITGIGTTSLSIIRAFGVSSTYVFACIPLFIFMGAMIESSGSAELAFDSLYRLMGNVKGSLAISTVLICTLFAATTGIIGASVTTMGMVALPAMLKRGYNKPLATGSICAGGTLGILIPPSIMLILYAPMAGISVARMFTGAILPGLLLSALYIIYIVVRTIINPSMGPSMSYEEKKQISRRETFSMAAKSLFPVLFLILAVLGSIFFGIAAPTEAASIGAFGSIVLAASYGKLNWQTLQKAIYGTLRITTMIIFIAMGANIFTSTLMTIGGGPVISNLLLGLGVSRWGILAIVLVIVFLLGMFMDWVGILLIVVPIFNPILSSLGFDPLWVGLIICISLQMSFLTPPFAYAIFYLKGLHIEGITMSDLYKGVVPFIMLQIIGTALCIIFPQIVTFLPRIAYIHP